MGTRAQVTLIHRQKRPGILCRLPGLLKLLNGGQLMGECQRYFGFFALYFLVVMMTTPFLPFSP